MSRAETHPSIRRRLVIAVVSFACACVAAGLWIAYLGSVLPDRQQLDAALLAQSTELVATDDALGHEGLVLEVERRIRERGPAGWQYAYWSPVSGLRFAGNLDLPPGTPLIEGLANLRLAQRTFRSVVLPLPGGRELLVGHDVSRQRLFERRLLLASLAAAIFVLAWSVGGGLWLIHTLLGRVGAMNSTVLSILRGQRSERVPSGRVRDEFQELATHFNQLLDENEQLIARMREVTNDIAHDLRTPLSRARGELEASLARPRSAAEDQAVLERTAAAIDAILESFRAMLELAQIESGAIREGMGPTDLAAVARDMVELYAPVAEDAGTELRLELPVQPSVRGNRHLLSRALSNLIDNAIKFSPPRTVIVVAVRAGERGPELLVADRGPGIPAEQREHVRERFVRLDASRGKPGAGLGLSLVAAIAHLHGAELLLQDNRPGLLALLRFPPGEEAGLSGAPGLAAAPPES